MRKDNIVNIIEISYPFDCNGYRLNFAVCYSHSPNFPFINNVFFFFGQFHKQCLELIKAMDCKQHA